MQFPEGLENTPLNHNKTYVMKELLLLLAFIKTTTVKIKLKLENKDLILRSFLNEKEMTCVGRVELNLCDF